jgi:hypothetical protein
MPEAELRSHVARDGANDEEDEAEARLGTAVTRRAGHAVSISSSGASFLFVMQYSRGLHGRSSGHDGGVFMYILCTK